MAATESDQNEHMAAGADRQFQIVEFAEQGPVSRHDVVAIEEPVEIRVVYGPNDKRVMRNVAITMRTPGHDLELAAGFLFTENLLESRDQIRNMETRGVDATGQATGNIVRVELHPEVDIDLGRLQRNFFTTSSCGVCGKASIESLHVHGARPFSDDDSMQISAATVGQLPDQLRRQQQTFQRTGGLHAAGLVDAKGEWLGIREDVGRHNAVDKLIGKCFLDGKTPLGKYVMIVSGRVSFEIMQKALVAGIPAIIAVGAPSSLAIDMAKQYNMTLIGFASNSRFNVYTGSERITQE